MNSPSLLIGSHLQTYNRFFQHPLRHPLRWREVIALFRQLGQVEEDAGGNWRVTCNHEILALQPREKEAMTSDEVVKLRHFLQRSQTPGTGTDGHHAHCLLVIDRRQVRIFHADASGGSLQQVLSQAREEDFSPSADAIDFPSRPEIADPAYFFAAVAEAFKACRDILIFATSNIASSELELFVDWLQRHQPATRRRILGTLVLADEHLTESQLLAKAREFHDGRRIAAPPDAIATAPGNLKPVPCDR